MSPEQEQEWKIRKLESINEALRRHITMIMKMTTNKSELEICNFISEIVEDAEKRA